MDWFRIETQMPQSMCSRCKKISSDYYELKLQIRFLYFRGEEEDKIKQEIKDLVENNLDMINKVEEEDGGFDIYFGTSSMESKISSLFRKYYFLEEKKSRKLVGWDFQNSKRNYRFFQSITIINLHEGDKIFVKGKKYRIDSLSNKEGITLIESGGKKRNFNFSKIREYIRF